MLAETHVALMPGGTCPCPLGALCQVNPHLCLAAAPLTHAASALGSCDGLHLNNTQHDYSKVKFRQLMTADAKVRRARAAVKAQLTPEVVNAADPFPGFPD